jgi:exonuclease VII large subunit
VNRAGLKRKEVELLTPAQLLSQFGTWDALSTSNHKTAPVAASVVLPLKASLDEDIATSNIALAKRVKELTEQRQEAEKDWAEINDSNKNLLKINQELHQDRSLLVTARDHLVENVTRLVKESERLKRELSEAQTLNKNLATQVIGLNADLDRATTPVAPKAMTPTLVHGELKITVVDMDASDKIRVILRGDGCRDVAHLVGRKIKLSRLSESE